MMYSELPINSQGHTCSLLRFTTHLRKASIRKQRKGTRKKELGRNMENVERKNFKLKIFFLTLSFHILGEDQYSIHGGKKKKDTFKKSPWKLNLRKFIRKNEE